MVQPIYLMIKQELKEKIKNGTYQSGDRIPSERELSNIFDISRMTARQAINELVKEGLVKREKGRGTFVESPHFLQRNIRSFTDTLREQGYEPSTKIIELSTIYSLKDISIMLNEPTNTHFFKIKRLRFADNIPVALETVYIPKYRCENINNYNLQGSLYEIFETNYQYIIQNISCKIDAILSNKAMMKLFNSSKPITLLKVEGINYMINGECLFYEESYYRSNIYKYQVDIFRR